MLMATHGNFKTYTGGLFFFPGVLNLAYAAGPREMSGPSFLESMQLFSLLFGEKKTCGPMCKWSNGG